MDLISVISFFLYLATFFTGFILDSKSSSRKAKKLYIVWLYIFLCFGYMTGSDWRAYELEYYSGVDEFYPTEFGYTFICDLAAWMNMDFWLLSGILKCLYLFVFVRIIKMFTPYSTSCIAICIQTSLLYMLIDYPMRFTAASTILLFSLPFLFQGKVLRFLLISSIGILFHNTIIITILICVVSYFIPDKLLKINKYVLCVIYIVFAIVASNISRVSIIQDTIFALSADSGVRDFSTYYSVEDNSSFFTVGSLITALLACFVFLIKDNFLNDDSKNKLVLKLSIVTSFLFRIVLIIPTGFRLTLPLGLFSTIIIITYLYKNKSWLKYLVIVLYSISLCRSLYNGYVYIPYTNSILYIITQDHLPYNERCQYNHIRFEQRTGHSYER